MPTRKLFTYADDRWNVLHGCKPVSPGCAGCWASKQAARHRNASTFCGSWTGEVVTFPERLEQPLRWRQPRVIATQFMGDLFYEQVPFEFIAAVFGVMAACPQHTFLLLTKRPERMAEWFRWMERHPSGAVPAAVWNMADQQNKVHAYKRRFIKELPDWPLPNVWLGISAEDQPRLEERWEHLCRVPAAKRWISLEPLLGNVDLHQQTARFCGCPQPSAPDPCDDWKEGKRCHWEPPRADWIVVGAESGARARPCRVEWLQSVVRQCRSANVPVHVKQIGADPRIGLLELTVDGGALRDDPGKHYLISDSNGGVMDDWPPDLRVREWPEVSND